MPLTKDNVDKFAHAVRQLDSDVYHLQKAFDNKDEEVYVLGYLVADIERLRFMLRVMTGGMYQ